MKQTVIFGFITIGVLLFASSALAAPERPTYDISGKWYVVAARGNQLPMPSCWSFEITPSEAEESFSVVSLFVDPASGESVKTILEMNRFDFANGFGGDQTQWFSLKGETSEDEKIAIDSVKFYYNTHDPVAALEDFEIAGANAYPLNKLFISRSLDITPEMVPIAETFIDHSDCSAESEVQLN